MSLNDKKDFENQTKQEKQETITIPTDRIGLIPLDPRYSAIWDNYKLQQGSFWVAGKIQFDMDAKIFKTMPKDIQNSLTTNLGFFAGSDVIVADNISNNLLLRITVPEIRTTYSFQVMMENVHTEVYGLLINKIVPDSKERARLFKAVETIPSVTAKAKWAAKYNNKNRSIAEVCVAYVCVEGIMFSSSFAFIDWIQEAGYNMEGLVDSNHYISDDEARHTEFGTLVYKVLDYKLTEKQVKEIIDSAVEVEIAFARDMLPKKGYTGMNIIMMSEHIQHCASIVAGMLGYPKMYPNTKCPFDFMSKRALFIKNNFFEKEGTNYNIAKASDEPFKISPDWD